MKWFDEMVGDQKPIARILIAVVVVVVVIIVLI